MDMAIVVGPTANLGNIGQVCAGILDGIADVDGCTLDLSSLTEIDLTFLQVLTATSRLAERDGKSVALLQPAGPAMAALMERAGFGESEGWSWKNPCTAGATGK